MNRSPPRSRASAVRGFIHGRCSSQCATGARRSASVTGGSVVKRPDAENRKATTAMGAELVIRMEPASAGEVGNRPPLTNAAVCWLPANVCCVDGTTRTPCVFNNSRLILTGPRSGWRTQRRYRNPIAYPRKSPGYICVRGRNAASLMRPPPN